MYHIAFSQGFEGNMFNKTFIKEIDVALAAAVSSRAIVPMSTPLPGCNTMPPKIPKAEATISKTTYNINILEPTRPTCFTSVADDIPTINEQNTKGIMVIFNNVKYAFPINSNTPLTKNSSRIIPGGICTNTAPNNNPNPTPIKDLVPRDIFFLLVISHTLFSPIYGLPYKILSAFLIRQFSFR